MHPFLVLQALRENFKDYVLSKYPWQEGNAEYAALADICQRTGEVFQDPVLQLERRRKKGETLQRNEPAYFTQPMQDALHKGFPPRRDGKWNTFREPYTHQTMAWERISSGHPTVVSTGTGSGKSESFMFPVLDRVLKSLQASPRAKDKGTVRAIIIYPMNALLEDQHLRLCRYASQLPTNAAGDRVRIGVYNGSFNEYHRDAEVRGKKLDEWRVGIFGKEFLKDEHVDAVTQFLEPTDPATYPDVLLTNYSMLQYMLLRKKEHGILANADLQALVLDEAHLYSGTLGLEIAGLLARLRVHIEAMGGSLKNCVPVATSATLVRGNDARDEKMMADFFSTLFARPFTGPWLIRDDFEDPGEPTPAVWKDLALPEAVGTFVATASEDVQAATETLLALHKTLQKEQGAKLQQLAQEMPALLLREPGDLGTALEPVVTLETATRRYSHWRLGTMPAPESAEFVSMSNELMGLLSLFSLPPREREFPLLGLRVHGFVKSEPRLFRRFHRQGEEWTKGDLVDDSRITAAWQLNAGSEKIELPAAFCKNCGHEGWIATVEEQGDHSLLLHPLMRAPIESDRVLVVHQRQAVLGDLPSGWNTSDLRIDLGDGRIVGSLSSASKKKSDPIQTHFGKSGASSSNGFVRVSRSEKEKGSRVAEEKPDHLHCPVCLTTSRTEQMRVGRGSASSDLSVHTRSLLATAENDDERRLILFCDNRQDTSFLAGFLTDRHKRFRLRRALCVLSAQHEKETGSPSLPPVYTDTVEAFPLAEAILSLLKVQADDSEGDDAVLPRTLRQVLTSDVFNFSDEYKRELRGQEDEAMLYKKIDPASHVRALEGDDVEFQLNLALPLRRAGEMTTEGRQILKLLTEAILRDLSMNTTAEGSLANLGIACLWHKELDNVNLPARTFAWRMFAKLASLGLWSVRVRGLEEGGRFNRNDVADQNLPDIAAALCSKNSSLGKMFRWEEQDLAQSWGLVEDGKAKDGEVARVLAGLRVLFGQWQKLEFIIVNDKDVPRIQSRGLEVRRDLTRHVSALRRKSVQVPKSFELEGKFGTFRKEDTFGPPTESKVKKGWNRLYFNTTTSDHFVRAHEHNAMLGSTAAATVIRAFSEKDLSKRQLNAVIATPTLEMGIDLPDLPSVVHKSVPPDPSNYAQRSGRAGRDKRRAFILAHCGRSSHDSAYFEEPAAMVAGEITPPGCPRENTFVLKRHAFALGFQVLAEEGCNLESWDSFVDRSQWYEKMKSEGQDISRRDNAEAMALFDWDLALEKRKGDLKARLASLIEQLKAGLWRSDLEMPLTENVDVLAADLVHVFSNGEFLQQLEIAIEGYRDLVNKRFSKLAASRSLPIQDMNRESGRQLAHLRSLLGLNFDRDQAVLRPIPWLQMHGMLPNFDFPTQTAMFTGLRESTRGRKRSQQDIAVRFARGIGQAMKEFAPEQNLYAAGHVFRINRYRVKRDDPSLCQDFFGVCSAGCSRLTKRERMDQTCTCGAKLISHSGNLGSLPPLYKLLEAEGEAHEYIGDAQSNREQDRLVREALVVDFAGGEVRRASATESLPGTTVTLYARATGANDSGAGLLDLMSVVGGQKRKGGEGNGMRRMSPLFADASEGEEFRVSLNAPEDQETGSSGGKNFAFPFLLGHRFRSEGVRFQFNVMTLSSLMPPRADNAPAVRSEAVYATFQAILLKAIRRVLFLGPRSHSLAGLREVVMEKKGEENFYPEVTGFLLYDTVQGGSGLMSLVRHYWPQICAKASELVRHCRATSCDTACKHCISGYDNQADHPHLDRSLLRLGSGKTVFDALANVFLTDATGWEVAQDKSNTTDAAMEGENQYAEQVFRDVAKACIPNVHFVEQVNVFEGSEGGLVTVPDFVLESNGRRVAVFVDGYKDHGRPECFVKDIHKRNFVQLCTGMPWVTLPASWVLRARDGQGTEALTEVLLRSLTAQEPEPVATGRRSVGISDADYELPFLKQYDRVLDMKILKLADGNLEAKLALLGLLGVVPAEGILVCEVPSSVFPMAGGVMEKAKWHGIWEDVAFLQRKGWKVVLLLAKFGRSENAA